MCFAGGKRCTKNELVALLTVIYAMCADFVKQYAKQASKMVKCGTFEMSVLCCDVL